jgi:isocitrate dehydrogenase kinase/phosphatase
MIKCFSYMLFDLKISLNYTKNSKDIEKVYNIILKTFPNKRQFDFRISIVFV